MSFTVAYTLLAIVIPTVTFAIAEPGSRLTK